jgi:hypothetical protein
VARPTVDSASVPTVPLRLGRRAREAIGRKLFGKLTVRDVKEAKADALMQLKIGRSAHYYTVAIFGGLLLDGFLTLYFPPNLRAGAGAGFASLYFLGIPILAGLLLSVFGLRAKWDAGFVWPWERHFWMALGALALAFGSAWVYFAHLFGYGAAAHWNLLPLFYPIALLGPGAALATLALAWSGWGNRKIAAVASSLLPVPLAFAVYLPSAGSATATSDLALSLIASGGLFLASGSFLHLIASGTRTHEREVLRSGQNRLFAFAEELRHKEEALRFRETSLVRREADADSAEAVARRRLEAAEDQEKRLGELESDLRAREQKIHEGEQKALLQSAEIAAARRALEDGQARSALRETDLEARSGRLVERERALVELEGTVTRQRLEVAAREKDLARREESLKQGESRVDLRRKELEAKASELALRETRANSVAGKAGAAPGSVAASLADREARLTRLRSVLDEQNQLLGQKARELEERLADARRREAEVAQHEARAAAREADLRAKETDLGQKLQWAQDRQTRYEAAVAQSEARLAEIDRKQAGIDARIEETRRATEGVQARERTLSEREAAVGKTRTELERRERELLERERELEARESEVSLRRQALGVRPAEEVELGSAAASAGGSALAEREKALEWRERTLREREAELAKREYQVEHPAQVGDDGLVGSTPTRRIADRRPTGTPRLDDLLLGGIPPRGHVLVVGPPFTSKEIALYAFIAEGLKLGEPVVLVTASRPPEEVAQEIGVLSPQFREYEQLGRIVWIDASNPAASPGPSGTESNGGTVRVRGPADHKGILSALTQAAMRFEHNGGANFRVGFLGLSACLSQGDEKSGYAFLQNFVGILKTRSALALYVVDRGTLSDTQVETVQARMDGALDFKTDRGKTFLAVRGLGDVATRDWVEYRATNRALAIGSFSLERIR